MLTLGPLRVDFPRTNVDSGAAAAHPFDDVPRVRDENPGVVHGIRGAVQQRAGAGNGL